MAQKRLVLSDASPLIALAATGTFGLLRELFDFTGTLGILAVAKRRRLIPALKPCLERLFEHGFHFSPELARSLLKDVGEG